MGDSAARRSEFQSAIEALIVQGWHETGPSDMPDMSFMDGPQLEEAQFLVLDGLGGRSPRIEGFAGIGMRPWITVRQIRVHEDALIAGSLSFQGADETFALPIANLAPWIRASSRVWRDVLRSRDRDNDGSDDDVGADHEDGDTDRPRAPQSGASPEMKLPNLEGLFEGLRSSGWSVGPSAKVPLRRGPFTFDAQISELPTSANEPRRSYLLEAQLFTLPQQQKELYEGAPLPVVIFRDAISEEMRIGRSYSWATVYNGEVREFTATLDILASTLRRILPEVKHYGAKTFDFVVSLVAGSRADHLGAEGLATAYQDVAALFDVGSGGSKPFVFFVDDLDRCTPERVADFVESIHSLTAAGCVAFLACDEEYVSAALNARYEKIVKYHKDSTAFGRRFLEKVVQLPFRIPAVDESGIHELGFVTLPQRVAATPEIETPHAGDAKEPSVEVKAKTSTPLPPPAPPINAAQLREILGEIMSGAIESLELNVRQIKSLTNSLKLYLSIQGNLTEDEARCTAAFVFAERYDPAWLHSIYHGSEDGNTVIGRHKALAARLKSMIGDDRERMRALYRLVGRQTEASQATSQAMA